MITLSSDVAHMMRTRLDQREGVAIIASPHTVITALGDRLPLNLITSLIEADDAGHQAVLHPDDRLETYSNSVTQSAV